MLLPSHFLYLATMWWTNDGTNDGCSILIRSSTKDVLLEPLVCNIPTIVSIYSGRRLVDFKLFKFHKELIACGVAMIQDTIVALVFNEDLHTMMRRFKDYIDWSVDDP